MEHGVSLQTLELQSEHSLTAFKISLMSSYCLSTNGLTRTLVSLFGTALRSISTYSSVEPLPKIFFKFNTMTILCRNEYINITVVYKVYLGIISAEIF